RRLLRPVIPSPLPLAATNAFKPATIALAMWSTSGAFRTFPATTLSSAIPSRASQVTTARVGRAEPCHFLGSLLSRKRDAGSARPIGTRLHLRALAATASGSCVVYGALSWAKNPSSRRLTRQIGQKRLAANRWHKRLRVT